MDELTILLIVITLTHVLQLVLIMTVFKCWKDTEEHLDRLDERFVDNCTGFYYRLESLDRRLRALEGFEKFGKIKKTNKE